MDDDLDLLKRVLASDETLEHSYNVENNVYIENAAQVRSNMLNCCSLFSLVITVWYIKIQLIRSIVWNYRWLFCLSLSHNITPLHSSDFASCDFSCTRHLSFFDKKTLKHKSQNLRLFYLHTWIIFLNALNFIKCIAR